jgi:hypothetical protein
MKGRARQGPTSVLSMHCRASMSLWIADTCIDSRLASYGGISYTEIGKFQSHFGLTCRTAFPAGSPYAASTESLRLQEPLNVAIESLSPLSSALPVLATMQVTHTSFHSARAQMARLMLLFFSKYRQTEGKPGTAKYDLVIETDTQLVNLLNSSPFSPTAPREAAGAHAWYWPAKRLFQSLLAHKRLLVHRDFFANA